MFIGRERELNTLSSLYQTDFFQFPVIYGRRRVGKTSLLAAFAQDKPTVFFTAVEDSPLANLRNLSRAIYGLDQPDVNPELAPTYADFQSAFEAVFARAHSQRIVFVIDEYPYLAGADPSVSSTLQMLIDRHKDESRLFLILCGSSLSFMKEQVLGEKSPLYGRLSAQIELKPFDFFDARRFFPEASAEQAATYYGIAGGIPLYLREFDDSRPLLDNIEQALLSPSSLLYEEPMNLLKQEVQKAALYNAIIASIAQGKSTSNEIATTVGIQSSEAAYYLKELQRIGLVRRVSPIVGGGRRAYYRLNDNLFRFWARFVLPSKTAVERGMARRALARIDEHLSEYMGPVFEDICREWLWRENVVGALPVEFDDAGTWWGPDPQTRTEEEIDIVCMTDSRPSVVAECKWTNQQVGAGVSEKLRERSGLIRASATVERYLFAKRGFTDACLLAAEEDPHLHAMGLEDMG